MSMDRFVNNIGERFVEKKALNKDALDIFVYGLDVLLFNVSSVAVILFLGWAFDCMLATVMCLCTYVPLQTIGGGYHAKTHLRCFLTTLSGWAAAMLLIHYIPPAVMIGMMIIGIISVVKYAPIEHENAPMSDGHKQKMRRVALKLCFVLTCLTLASALWNPLAFIAMSTGLGMIGLSMNASYLSKKHAGSA